MKRLFTPPLNSGGDVRIVLPGQVSFRGYEPVKVGIGSHLLFFDDQGQRIDLAKEAVANA